MIRFFSILSLFILCQTSAYSNAGPIINTSDELFEVASFSEKIIKHHPDLKNLKIGYKCSRFGLVGADVWTWDCSLVAISSLDSKSYYDLPDEILTEIKDNPDHVMEKANRNLWNRYGILILIVLIVGYFAFRARKKISAWYLNI